MTETPDRVCKTCGESEEMARLETCSICRGNFCPDCAHRAFGRRFCSHDCSRAYFAGESDDDDEDAELDDE